MFLVRSTIRRALAFALATAPIAAFGQYTEHNLVSDGYVSADHIDPNLVNPWGISASATGPFWVSNNGSGSSTLYNTTGAVQALVVTIPSASGSATGSPTGQVFNSSTGFKIGSTASKFLFATEDGTISGWASGTTATILKTKAGGSYKGLGIGTDASNNTYLYAADFANGTVDRYDSNMNLVSGGFTDPALAAGYDPYNVQVLGGNVFVTYAQNNGSNDSTGGLGTGYVDEYSLSGSLIARVATGGTLSQAWGLALAPSGFGQFSNDLLVGNFGTGTINAYDLSTDTYNGQLTGTDGNPISIDGLWGLQVGNGGSGGLSNSLYFTAGLDGEQHGLFGSLQAVPEPSALIIMTLGGLAILTRKLRS